MTTINGLPAHVLLVHVIVVLAPLTALLAIICAIWPAARRRLVWLVLALAAITTAATPLTTDAGEWLAKRVGESRQLHTHAELGDTMIYYSVARASRAWRPRCRCTASVTRERLPPGATKRQS